MAFSVNGITVIGQAAEGKVWFYRTSTDAKAVVIGNRYFSNKSGVSVGDVIIVSASDGQVVRQVSAVSSAGATTR